MSNCLVALAMVLAGEAGVVPDAQPMIAHTVMNRVASDSFPNTIEAVLLQEGQWNGWAEPTDQSLYWARKVMRRDSDPTGGMLFALSGDDHKRLGCPVGDIVFVNRDHSVHLYREWCP